MKTKKPSQQGSGKGGLMSTNPFDKEYSHFIGGEWVKSESNETFDALNPATGEVLARVQFGQCGRR